MGIVGEIGVIVAKIGVLAMMTTLVLGSAASAATESTCLLPDTPRGDSSHAISLLTNIASPYFYFRSFDYNLAILIPPSTLRNAALAAESNGSRDAGQLLKLLDGDLPLVRNTDLFAYVLRDSYHFSTIQHILSEVLASGAAAVFDARTGESFSVINITQHNSKQIRRRTFFALDKTMLLQSLDCIQN